jgi:phosphoesterase RecJ-like protein
MTEWQELKAVLTGHREAVILVHEKPDGDCLGSGLALGLGLKSMGIKPSLFLSEPLPALYRFLPGQDMIKTGEQEIRPGVLVVAVDCADEARFDYRIPEGNPVINIDHHTSNTNYGKLNIVDPGAAAAGEIIFRLFVQGNIAINREIATCLYVAIATDTGSFRFSNMTRNTFTIAGELVEKGADLDLIRNQLYEKRPYDELLVIKAALKSISRSNDGKLLTCSLSYDDLKRDNLFASETDGIATMMRAVDGAEVAMLFKEIQPNEVKVSFRSKSYFDVNELAKVFQGGGHPRAAGCIVKASLEDACSRVIKEYYRMMEGRTN